MPICKFAYAGLCSISSCDHFDWHRYIVGKCIAPCKKDGAVCLTLNGIKQIEKEKLNAWNTAVNYEKAS